MSQYEQKRPYYDPGYVARKKSQSSPDPSVATKSIAEQFLFSVYAIFKDTAEAGVALIVNNDGTTQKTKNKKR